MIDRLIDRLIVVFVYYALHVGVGTFQVHRDPRDVQERQVCMVYVDMLDLWVFQDRQERQDLEVHRDRLGEQFSSEVPDLQASQVCIGKVSVEFVIELVMIHENVRQDFQHDRETSAV